METKQDDDIISDYSKSYVKKIVFAPQGSYFAIADKDSVITL